MARLSVDREKYREASESRVNQGYAPIPEGVYPAAIEEAEVRRNKAGTGDYLKMKWVVADGQHRGRVIWDNITVSHQQEKSVSIGLVFLSKLCDAVGLAEPPDDTDMFHGRSCAIRVVVREQEGYPPDNKIRGYFHSEAAQRVPEVEMSRPVDKENPYAKDDDIPF